MEDTNRDLIGKSIAISLSKIADDMRDIKQILDDLYHLAAGKEEKATRE